MITRELNVGRSGIVQFKLASELYTQIMEYIGTEPNDKITQNMTDRLAGHIKKEFNLENIKPKLWEDFTTFFESIVYQYEDVYQFESSATALVSPSYNGVDAYTLDGYNKPCFQEEMNKINQDGRQWAISLDSLWVNYQKKYEFNPPHSHSGHYSFVVFMKIPYDDDEFNYYQDVNASFLDKTGINSCFNLNKIDPWIKTTQDISLRVSKKHEGVGLLFPSQTCHSVHPFYTSDDYRITIAGNISAVEVDFGMQEQMKKPPSFKSSFKL